MSVAPEPEWSPSPGGPPVVEQARPCLQCGYNLRGLVVTGSCPECGAPVAISLRGNLLIHSSLEYLRLLHWGALLALLSALVFLAARGWGLLGGIVRMVLLGRGATWSSMMPQIGPEVAEVVGACLGFSGWWLLCSPDPGHAGRDAATGTRRLVRVVAVVGIVTALAAGAMGALLGLGVLTPGPGAADPVTLCLSGARLAGQISWCVLFFGAMEYLRHLARRMPDRELYQSLAHFLWVGPVVYTLLYVCLGLGPLIVMCLYAMILNRVRRRVQEARYSPLRCDGQPVTGA